MSEPSKIKSWRERMREKHKLSFINDSNYHEKWSFRLSAMNLWTLFVMYTIFVVILVFLLIRFTPLSGLFGQKSDSVSQEQIQHNSELIDSLSDQNRSREKYLNDLRKILNDEPFDDSVYQNLDDTLFENYTPDFTKAKEDSLLRLKN